ncbi:MAG TPA: MarR family transcriptional regulator [Acetobacteraceae bacterium]|nr:MarR family transcriptional regulator [Acetobacteraceae bacterium]
MNQEGPTLGTLLRHLIEVLDGAVEEGYKHAGLDYRARYTPIVRALMDSEIVSIKLLAHRAGVTHSAASQTVAQMAKAGLVDIRPGLDAREHLISFSLNAVKIIPTLQELWQATNAAATELDAELPYPLSKLLKITIATLERRSFADRREHHIRANKVCR